MSVKFNEDTTKILVEICEWLSIFKTRRDKKKTVRAPKSGFYVPGTFKIRRTGKNTAKNPYGYVSVTIFNQFIQGLK